MTAEFPNAAERSNTRITVGDYFADIVINREHLDPIYYWIAQQVGSADIIGWGQEDTFEAAEQSARQFLRERSNFPRRFAASNSD